MLKLGRGVSLTGLGRSFNPLRNNSAAKAERVVPLLAACRFKSWKTGSGMIRVVFIWKTIPWVRRYGNLLAVKGAAGQASGVRCQVSGVNAGCHDFVSVRFRDFECWVLN